MSIIDGFRRIDEESFIEAYRRIDSPLDLSEDQADEFFANYQAICMLSAYVMAKGMFEDEPGSGLDLSRGILKFGLTLHEWFETQEREGLLDSDFRAAWDWLRNLSDNELIEVIREHMDMVPDDSSVSIEEAVGRANEMVDAALEQFPAFPALVHELDMDFMEREPDDDRETEDGAGFDPEDEGPNEDVGVVIGAVAIYGALQNERKQEEHQVAKLNAMFNFEQ